jgi:hypothetical protein
MSAQRKSRFPSVIMAWLISISLIGGLAGCSAFKVKLVGEYDEITDNAVITLHQKTAGFFSKMKTASGDEASYEANRGFYADVQGDVAALILRAEVVEEGQKRNPLTRNFRDLRKQYDDLESLHKTSTSKKVFESSEKAFDQSFRAICTHIMYLKWNQEQKEIVQ